MSEDETTKQKHYKVVIVGAGVSGLSAAIHLLQNGLSKDDILLLEARSRIGGRVIAINMGETKVRRAEGVEKVKVHLT